MGDAPKCDWYCRWSTCGNYEYLMDKTVARETPVVYPPGTARAARAFEVYDMVAEWYITGLLVLRGVCWRHAMT